MNRVVVAALACVLAVVPSVFAGQETASHAAPVVAGAPVNLNSASVAQLEALPGIGKATAERIVEYRQKSGGFKKSEDLMNVRGIGEKNFLKLKPLITVGSGKADRASQ